MKVCLFSRQDILVRANFCFPDALLLRYLSSNLPKGMFLKLLELSMELENHLGLYKLSKQVLILMNRTLQMRDMCLVVPVCNAVLLTS